VAKEFAMAADGRLKAPWNNHKSVEDALELAFMDTIDVFRQAVKRTFADLYGVARHEVDAGTMTGRTSLCVVQIKPSHTKLSMMMTTACSNSFLPMRPPATVRSTNDERLRLERTDLDRLNGY
jgi:hypothetical protein